MLTCSQALAGYSQQDAHEYMQHILNNLHQENGGTESNGKDGEGDCTCLIHKTFSGKLQSTVTCDKCRNVTTAIDPVMDLSLDLRSQAKKRKLEGDSSAEKNPTLGLRDCLDRFTGKEKLAAADYSCEKCGGTQQNATKQLSIKKLPPVLPIHLKVSLLRPMLFAVAFPKREKKNRVTNYTLQRFETSKSTSTKLETKIAFPMSLDLYPYTTRGRASSKDSTNGAKDPKGLLPTPTCMYELASVIVHKGKIDSGHYVSYSRKGGDWFLFDDSKVVLASEADVLRAEAYLLVYVVRSLEG